MSDFEEDAAPEGGASGATENPYFDAWADYVESARLERDLFRKLVVQIRPSFDEATPLEFAKLTSEWQAKFKTNESLIRRLRKIAGLRARARSSLLPNLGRPDVEKVVEALARIEATIAEADAEAVDDFGNPKQIPHGPTYFSLVDSLVGKGSIRFFERVYRPFSKNPYHKPGQAEAEYALAMAHFHHGGKDRTVRTMLSSATTRHPVAVAQMQVREGEYQREVGMKSRKGKEIVHARKAMAAYIEGLGEIQTAASAVEGIERVIQEAQSPDTKAWLRREYPPGTRLQLLDAALDVDPSNVDVLRRKSDLLKKKGNEREAEFIACAAKIVEFVARGLQRLVDAAVESSEPAAG